MQMPQNTAAPKKPDTASIHILKLLGMGVLITAAVLFSPDFLYKAAKRYLKYGLKGTYDPEQIKKSIRYLKRKKFVAFEKRTSKLKLTLLGKRRLCKINFEDITIPRVPWDGRWRLLMFDIPEEAIQARHVFRRRLKELGFFHFQRSVFICPYPCEEQIQAITDQLQISRYVHILLAERFKGDKALLRVFR